MYNAHKPEASELPSNGKLLRSTGVAALVAGVLLTTVVLPAEYAVDPTGVGQVLGLTEMGRVKRSLAAETERADAAEGGGAADAENLLTPEALATAPASASTAAPVTSAPGAPVPQSHVTTLTLAPNQGAEIKLVMREGGRAQYLWETDGARVNFDVHGDWPGASYHGYGKGSDTRAEGVLVAAATGNHGWFWRNRTDGPVTITLRTSGDYAEIKRVV